MRPTVLCFSGLDPSGGAGLQADIESIQASGSRASVICTALTIQSSQQVFGFEAVNADLIQKQAKALLDDFPIQAIKTGMLGSVETIHVIQNILKQNPKLPYVLDPVIVANSGGSLGDPTELVAAFKQLIPFSSLITPNTVELKALTSKTDHDEAVAILFELGASAVLVKGGHELHPYHIQNKLYEADRQHGFTQTSIMTLPRLQGEYHGSGCSLASFIAGLLAQSVPLQLAAQTADLWLHRALVKADRPHEMGQYLPRR